jgi:hypothetical protein
MSAYRVALYYLPAEEDPLWALGSAWLGWDSRRAASLPRPYPAVPARRAARYGLHATIKAPMPLSAPLDRLQEVARSFLHGQSPVILPSLQLSLDDGFLSLRLATTNPALQALADGCVRALDPFRRPYEPAELAARDRPDYSPRQRQQLADWGYPHVFADFVFHMTLSDRLSPENTWLLEAQAYFGPSLALPRRLDSLALLVQEGPDRPFVCADEIPLGSGR